MAIDVNTNLALTSDILIDQDESSFLDDTVDFIDAIPEFLVSSGADLATSLWNSFATEDSEVTTSDLLGSAGFFDSQEYYERHKGLVEFGSLALGAVGTGFGVGAIVNALKAGRIGSNTFNVFSKLDNYAARNKQKAIKLLEEGPMKTSEYKKAMTKFKLQTAGQGLVEGVAQEAAFLALMREHAWMEDYGVGTFLLGAGLYNLGLPFKYAAANKEISLAGREAQLSQLEGVDVNTILHTPTMEGIRDTMEANAHRIDRIQRAEKTIQNLAGKQFGIDVVQDSVNKDIRSALEEYSSIASRDLLGDSKKLTGSSLRGDLLPTERAGQVDTTFQEDLFNYVYKDASKSSLSGVEKISKFSQKSILGNTLKAGGSLSYKEIPGETGVLMVSKKQDLLDSGLFKSTGKVITETPNGVKTVIKPNGKLEITIEPTATLNDNLSNYISGLLFRNDIADNSVKIIGVGRAKAFKQAFDNTLLSKSKKGAELRRVNSRLWDKILSSKAATVSDNLIGENIDDVTAVFDRINNKMYSSSDAAYFLRAGDVGEELKPLDKIKIRDKSDFLEFMPHKANKRYLEAFRGKGIKENDLIIHQDNLPVLDAFAATNRTGISVVDDSNKLTLFKDTDKLKQHIIDTKTRLAQELGKKGFYDEQVGIYLNMPVSTVEKLKLAQWKPTSKYVQDLKFTDFQEINSVNRKWLSNYYNKSKVHLEGDTSVAQDIISMRPRTIHDRETLRNMHGSFASSSFAHSNTPDELVNLKSTLIDDPLLRELETNIGSFTSSQGLGNRFWTSADMALRNAGDLGKFAVSMGQAFKNISQNITTKYIKGLAPSVAAIRSDRSQAILGEQFLNRYHSYSRGELNGSYYDKVTGAVYLKPEKISASGEKLEDAIPMTWEDGKNIVIDPKSAVGKFLDIWQDGANKFTRELGNLNNRLKGKGDDYVEGLYFPYTPLNDKLVGYIYNKKDPSKSKIFTARTEEELANIAKQAKSKVKSEEEIVLRSDAEDWRFIHGYAKENEYLVNANPELKKLGISPIGISPTGDSFIDVLQSFSSSTTNKLRSTMKLSHSQLFDELNTISSLYRRGVESGNKSLIRGRELDFGTVIRDTLLNQNSLSEFPLWKGINSWTEVAMNRGLNSVSKFYNTFKNREMSLEDFNKLSQDLDSKGIPNPYTSALDFMQNNIPKYKNLSDDVIGQSTALMATLNLRLLEAAHAAITTLTWPIVASSVLSNEKASYPMKHMYEAVRMMFAQDDFSKAIRQRSKDMGFTEMKLIELTDSFAEMHQVGKLNKVLNSNIVKLLSKPSDWSEHAVRQLSYNAAISLARQRDPSIVDRVLNGSNLDLAEHFAANFTSRTMGNYSSTQRPILFQGQLGHLMSVYQTFMLTTAQNLFKFLEDADKKAMIKFIAAQTGIFGSSSLPGYDWLNRQIGAYITDDNQDITSMTYRLFGENSPGATDMAEFVLYGFPSWMSNSALSSRATLEPRLPLEAGNKGIGILPPAVSFAFQAGEAAFNTTAMITNTFQNDGSAMDLVKAGIQGLAMQSISRPVKGMAEIAQGYTTDAKGEVISNNSLQEWSNVTRAVGLTPLEEYRLKETRFTGRYYDQVDRSNRQRTIQTLRRQLTSDGNINIGSIMTQYLDRGGNARGWQQIINQVYKEIEVPLAQRLERELAGTPLVDYVLDQYL